MSTSWNWSAAAAALSPDASSPPRGPGTLSSFGFAGGVSTETPSARRVFSSSPNGVRLILLDVLGLGVSFCGGIVGKRDKMCVARTCLVSSHKTRKHRIERFGDTDGEDLVFISCYGVEDQVHVEPFLGVTYFGGATKFSRYERDLRSVDDWCLLFKMLQSQDKDPEDVDLDDVVEVAEKAKMGKTPLKKRTQFELRSPELDAGLEATLAEIDKDLGPEETVVTNLRLQWGLLANNLDTIKTLLGGQKGVVKRLAQEVAEEFESLDVKLTRLAALVGERKKSDSGLSVFREVEDLREEVDEMKKASPTGGLDLRSLQELLAFGKRISDPNSGKIGDLLESVVGSLQNRQSKLENKVQSIRSDLDGVLAQAKAGQGLGGPFGIGMTSGGPSPGTVTVAEFKGLQDKVADLVDQMSSQHVTAGGRVFRSLSETTAWLSANAGGPTDFLLFVDPHAMLSLLEMAAQGSSSDLLSFEAASAKSGYSSPHEALIITSFKTELPSFFGKEGKSSLFSTAKQLPGLKTYAEWDAQDGYSGKRHQYEREVRRTEETLLEAARVSLKGDALVVAIDCITRSSQFLLSLGIWMGGQHNDLVGRGGTTGEVWDLISHSVRAVFSSLHEARIPGRGSEFATGNRRGSVLWGMLQGLWAAKELSDKNFSAHPKLSHILNLHLQDQAVMKSDFDRLKNKQEELESKFVKLQKTADGAISAAKSKK